MPLKKPSGNMYPWVTHTHNHLAGECPHRCSYCYVDNPRFGRPVRYTGPIRLVEDELRVNYGSGRTIFVENMTDLFAEAVPAEYIAAILAHCREYPDNTYVFQSKNPARVVLFAERFPAKAIFGTTIECGIWHADIMGQAPRPAARLHGMLRLREIVPALPVFVTVEPILAGELATLFQWLRWIKPSFVNIGADSKRHGLQEPAADDVNALIEDLRSEGIEIREKINLERLLRIKK